MEGTVKRRKKSDNEYGLVGTKNDNPLLDTRVYEVEFPDGTYGEYAANVLIENIFAQVDEEDKTQMILSEIVDHKSDENALTQENGWIQMKNGVKKRAITTKGWKLKVQWKDGTESWISLKDPKESIPIEVAEYAISRNINHEPAFVWWVNKILRRRNIIIKKVKARLAKKSIKYEILVPSSVEEAELFD